MKENLKKPIFYAVIVICIFLVLVAGFMHIKQIDKQEKEKATVTTSTSTTSKTGATSTTSTNSTTIATRNTMITTEATTAKPTTSTTKETAKPTQNTQYTQSTKATTTTTQSTSNTQNNEEHNNSNATFYLSDYERRVVECLVMGESGAESYEGQVLVAQCILNGCIKEGVQPSQLRNMYGYYGWHDSPSQSVKNAVSAVFDNGHKATNEFVLYFYAPAYCTSSWHESQRFVAEVGGHRFFAGW